MAALQDNADEMTGLVRNPLRRQQSIYGLLTLFSTLIRSIRRAERLITLLQLL